MKTDELLPKILVAVKTPEGRAAIKTFAGMYNEIWQKAEACSKTFDWGVIPSEILIKLRVIGLEEQLKIVQSVPEKLREIATPGDCKLYVALRTVIFEGWQSLEDTFAKLLIGLRCAEVIAKRELKTPIGRWLLQLMALEDFDIAPVEKDESGRVESYILEQLLNELRPEMQLQFPQEAKSHQSETKDEVAHTLISKALNELRELDIEEVLLRVVSGELEKLKQANLRDSIDEVRYQTAKKRMPSGEFQSLGNKVQMLEVLAAEHESLQTQPRNIRSQLTASQKKTLREFLGETELKIFESFYNHPDFTQEEVAEHVGCTQSKVSKARRKFRRFEEKIKKILEIV